MLVVEVPLPLPALADPLQAESAGAHEANRNTAGKHRFIPISTRMATGPFHFCLYRCSGVWPLGFEPRAGINRTPKRPAFRRSGIGSVQFKVSDCASSTGADRGFINGF